MHVDRPRQRDPVDRQFLIVDPIGCKTGEQHPDKCDKSDDETQPNHSLTQKRGIGKENDEAFDDRPGADKPKRNESQPFGIVEG
ncbi:hypothetical protein GALL_519280 [mine drainage metagenome]|uniref:Uncharacterized protein n=1 Tax=mine drainage metagenome TaxID=410659 RepID=A0A1J5PSG1_9ZZZZ